ncbi:MAG: hypothetical protein AAGE94_08725 [Acidobacteriota bacterium]
MSVQAVSRIAALLALDVDMVRDYVPKYADDDYDQEEDLNEEKRSYLAYLWRGQLTEDEKALVADGDMNAVLQYLANHLEKPVNGERIHGGGDT